MKVTFTIAKYTVVEAFRDKFIWVVLAIMLAGIPLGFFLRTLTLFGYESVMPATAITVISIAVTTISVLYVNIATRRELDSKIMLVVLSRPVSNTAYLLGKHLGFWAVCTVYVILGSIIIKLLGIGSAKTILVFAFGLWLLQCLSVAWSLFFSLLLNSLAASTLISVIAWIFFSSVQTLWNMTAWSESVLTKIIGKVFYYIMPNYSRFDFKHILLYDESVVSFNIAILPVYTIVYATIIMLIMWIDFSRKEY